MIELELAGIDHCRSSAIEYVGVQTVGGKKSDFREIKATIAANLENNNVRSRRHLSVIFKALKVNRKAPYLAPLTRPLLLVRH